MFFEAFHEVVPESLWRRLLELEPSRDDEGLTALVVQVPVTAGAGRVEHYETLPVIHGSNEPLLGTPFTEHDELWVWARGCWLPEYWRPEGAAITSSLRVDETAPGERGPVDEVLLKNLRQRVDGYLVNPTAMAEADRVGGWKRHHPQDLELDGVRVRDAWTAPLVMD